MIKSEAPDVLVDTLLESRDVTFFENIFPMNVAYSLLSSSNEFIHERLMFIKFNIEDHIGFS